MPKRSTRMRLIMLAAATVALLLVGCQFWRASWSTRLRATIDQADRVRIRTGGACHRREADEQTLFESTNAAELKSLADTLDVTRPWTAMSCKCCGGPTFEFYAGDRLLAMLSLHHNQSLRWPEEWSGDGQLTAPSRNELNRWLAARIGTAIGPR